MTLNISHKRSVWFCVWLLCVNIRFWKQNSKQFISDWIIQSLKVLNNHFSISTAFFSFLLHFICCICLKLYKTWIYKKITYMKPQSNFILNSRIWNYSVKQISTSQGNNENKQNTTAINIGQMKGGCSSHKFLWILVAGA